jgi:acyl-CoA thioesterase-1
MFLKYCLSIFLLLFATAAGAETRILFLGDSITAGYGVLPGESYPALLEARWRKAGKRVTVINGAESASLASGLKKSLDFHVKRSNPKVIVIVSGGNDARQMTSPPKIEIALRDAVRAAKKSGATVVLGEMRIFPNLGKEYVASFTAIYPRLAKSEKVELLPFLLEGVAGDPAMNQADGFHPNKEGHRKIADRVGPFLEKLL